MTSTANLLSNASFKEQLAYWDVSTDDSSQAVGIDFAPKWSVDGAATAYLFADDPEITPTLSQDVQLPSPPSGKSADNRLQLSGFFGTHRTDIVVEVHIGSPAGDEYLLDQYRVPVRSDRLGGTALEDYQFAAFFPLIPAEARSVRISLALGGHNGDLEPGRFGFVTHLSLQEAPSRGVAPAVPDDLTSEQLRTVLPLESSGKTLLTPFPIGSMNGAVYGPARPLDEWVAMRLDGCNLLTCNGQNPWDEWDAPSTPGDSVGADFSEKWKVSGVPTLYWRTVEASDVQRIMRAPETAVIPGMRYELSVYLAYHRCKGSIGVEWFDDGGSIVSVDELYPGDAEAIGGSVLGRYDQQWAVLWAPQDAASARVFLRRSGTQVGADSFMFAALPFFALSSADQPHRSWNEFSREALEPELRLLEHHGWVQCAGEEMPGATSMLEAWSPTSAQRQVLVQTALARDQVDEVLTLLRRSEDIALAPDVLNALVDLLLEREKFDTAVEAAYYAFTLHPSQAVGERLNAALKGSRFGTLADFLEKSRSRGRRGEGHESGSGVAFHAAEVPRAGLVGLGGNTLVVWTVDRARTVEDLAVRVDGQAHAGTAKAEGSSPVETISYARLMLPDTCMDGQEHAIELVDIAEGRVCWSSSIEIKCRVNIEQVTGGAIRGWIASSVEMGEAPELVVFVDGMPKAKTVAASRRSDVEEALSEEFASAWAFECAADLTSVTRKVEVGFPESTLAIEGSSSWILDRQAGVNAVRAIQRHVDDLGLSEPAKQWLTRNVVPAMLDSARGKNPALEKLDDLNLIEPTSVSVAETDSVVDVVVPVYRDLDATRACLESVLAAKVDCPTNIIVINDASPEADLSRWLEKFCSENDLELLVHRDNRGFPATANEGMTANSRRDVVLLNSDAIVSDGWIDELRHGAYSRSKVASVTAMSNSATVFSYPIPAVEQEVPSDIGRTDLAALALDKSRGEFVESPTCHGFCVYLRRDALDEVGLFDDQAFTKGYGEETDWSQRANDRGWCHLASPAVFVEHLGSRSFQGDRTALLQNSFSVIRHRYPEYDGWIQDFIDSDPLSVYRRRLDLPRIKARGNDFTLHITHHLGGGTEKHVRDITETYAADGAHALVLHPDPRRTSTHVLLSCPGLELESSYAVESEYDALVADLKNLGVSQGHLHHLIGFAPGFPKRLFTDLGVTYAITMHDYAAACPRIFITRPNGDFCGGPRPIAECAACVAKHGPLEPARDLFESLGGTVEDWVEHWQDVLGSAEELLFPTQSQLDRFAASHLSHSRMRVVPHPEEEFPPPIMPAQGQERYTVALLGGLSWEKGFGRLRDLAELAEVREAPMDFIVIGPTADDAVFAGLPNVRIHGMYKPESTQALLDKYDPDVVLFLSVWPETWCYTLSEAMTNRRSVVAPRLGAFADRLSNHTAATLFEPDGRAGEVLDALSHHLQVD